MRKRWRARGLVFAASLIVCACGSVEPVPFPTTPTNTTASTVPASLVLTASSRVDQKLDVAATVLSADGHGLPNVVVTFGIGAGDITPTTAVTDTAGTAHAVATSPVSTTITATIGGGIVSTMEVLASR